MTLMPSISRAIDSSAATRGEFTNTLAFSGAEGHDAAITERLRWTGGWLVGVAALLGFVRAPAARLPQGSSQRQRLTSCINDRRLGGNEARHLYVQLGRQCEYAAFGCSRSAGILSRSMLTTCKRLLSPSLTFSAV